MSPPDDTADGTDGDRIAHVPSSDESDGGDGSARNEGTGPEALVRRYYECVDADDVEGLLELFSETITYERPGQDPIEGREELRAFYERDRPLEDGEHRLEAVIVEANDTGGNDDDSRVAVRGRFSGVQDGETVSFGFADFHELNDDGVIENRWTYTDRDTV